MARRGKRPVDARLITRAEYEAYGDDCDCASSHFRDYEAQRDIRDRDVLTDHIEDCLMRVMIEARRAGWQTQTNARAEWQL